MGANDISVGEVKARATSVANAIKILLRDFEQGAGVVIDNLWIVRDDTIGEQHGRVDHVTLSLVIKHGR